MLVIGRNPVIESIKFSHETIIKIVLLDGITDNKIKERITFNLEQINYLKQSLDKVKKFILKRKKNELKLKNKISQTVDI